MSGGWNYAAVWEAISERFPDEPALIHGDGEVTWQDFEYRAAGVAGALVDSGLSHQDKVVQYLKNRPEYLESLFATFKASLVPVNTNYRYGDDELVYLWDNSDAAAVVFEAEFTDTCDRLRDRLPKVRTWLRVATDGSTDPSWVTAYEDAAASGHRPARSGDRSGDDLYLLYTGGTTGMPKGVMWRQDDLFRMLEAGQGVTLPEAANAEAYVAALARRGPAVLPAAPLMHGAASWFVLPYLSRGSAVVTLTAASFDVVEFLDAIVAREVRAINIVGDAFAKPMIRQLDADPGRWDLSRLRVVVSSGAMLSQDSKQRLLGFAPNAVIADGLGSSESGSLATSVATRDSVEQTARFRLSPHTRVLDEHGRDVEPGSGQAGRLAVGGHIPLGYYGDPEKTAATFLEFDGRRYVVAGDWAQIEIDRTITLLGRGSACINTGGEKVYPEEVEEALKTAPGVQDAAVVGVPDERFGEAIVALVEVEEPRTFDEAALIAHVKQRLASYKAPRRVIAVPSVGRTPSGKLDYPQLKRMAETAGKTP